MWNSWRAIINKQMYPGQQPVLFQTAECRFSTEVLKDTLNMHFLGCYSRWSVLCKESANECISHSQIRLNWYLLHQQTKCIHWLDIFTLFQLRVLSSGWEWKLFGVCLSGGRTGRIRSEHLRRISSRAKLIKLDKLQLLPITVSSQKCANSHSSLFTALLFSFSLTWNNKVWT